MEIRDWTSIAAIMLSIAALGYTYWSNRTSTQASEAREAARFSAFRVQPTGGEPGVIRSGVLPAHSRLVNVGLGAAFDLSLDWSENDPKNLMTPPSSGVCSTLNQNEYTETWVQTFDPDGSPTIADGSDWAVLRWTTATNTEREQRIVLGLSTPLWSDDERYHQGGQFR